MSETNLTQPNLNNAIIDEANLPAGTQIINTEEEAREYLKNQQKVLEDAGINDAKKAKLERARLVQEKLQTLDEMYKKMGRRGKRRVVAKFNPRMKFSNRVKNALKHAESQIKKSAVINVQSSSPSIVK